MDKRVIIAAFSLLFAGAGAYGVEKDILPVLKFEYNKTLARIEKIEYSMNVDELHIKRVQLAKVKQEIEQYETPPSGLMEYKLYLEREIEKLYQEINS